MGLLDNKVAIVTGGARGIGQEICLGLAREGASVAALDIGDLDETRKKLASIGGSHIAARADVTRFDTLVSAVDEVIAKFGNIHILINNAGLYGGMERGPFDKLSEEGWDRMMAINVKGVWNMTRAVVPHMAKNQYGKIVNMSSTTVLVGPPMMLHYVASKGAVLAMTRSLAREVGPVGIRVNSLMPGLTMSQASVDNIANSGRPGAEKMLVAATALGKLNEPSDLVGTIAFLSSPLSDSITGQAVNVDGGNVFW